MSAPIPEDLQPLLDRILSDDPSICLAYQSALPNGKSRQFIDRIATLEAQSRQLREALTYLAGDVFGNGPDSEPDVYADYDRLCATQRRVDAALAATEPKESV